MEPNPTMIGPDSGPIGYDPTGRPVDPVADALRQQAEAYGTEMQQAVRQWIVDNQTVAVLAGFALGVFLGALMRK